MQSLKLVSSSSSWSDLNKKYSANEMAKGDVIFACAGVTQGYMLKGVKKTSNKIFVNSLLLDSTTKKVTNANSQYFLS